MRVYILLHGSMCIGICVNVYTHACLLLRTNTHDSSLTFSVTGIILFSNYRWWVMCLFIFGVYCDMLTIFLSSKLPIRIDRIWFMLHHPPI